MGENEEIVRRLYEAFNAKDSAVSERLLGDEVEWVNPDDAIEPGTRSGRDQYNEALRNFRRSFTDATIEVERVVESGDLVGAVVVLRARARGLPTEDRQGHLWTIRDGRAVRFEFSRGESGVRRVLSAVDA